MKYFLPDTKKKEVKKKISKVRANQKVIPVGMSPQARHQLEIKRRTLIAENNRLLAENNRLQMEVEQIQTEEKQLQMKKKELERERNEILNSIKEL